MFKVFIILLYFFCHSNPLYSKGSYNTVIGEKPGGGGGGAIIMLLAPPDLISTPENNQRWAGNHFKHVVQFLKCDLQGIFLLEVYE